MTEDELATAESLLARGDFLVLPEDAGLYHGAARLLLAELRRLRALFTEEDRSWLADLQAEAENDNPVGAGYREHERWERFTRARDLAARIRQVRPTYTGESPPP